MKFFKIVSIAAALATSGSALAATQTWDFINGGDTTIEGGHNPGNWIDMQRDGINLTLTAWSETLNGTCTDNTAPECQASGDNTSTENDPFIDTATLGYFGDTLGIYNQDGESDAPQHSIDNIPNSGADGYNDYDMVLLQFDQAITLDSVSVGWTANDSDMSIIAYTGMGDLNDSPFFADTKMWSDLLDEGWESVGDYSNVQGTQAIATSIESKYWLVGAYNPAFGGNLSDANDGFKLSAVSTTSSDGTAVPEPASILLMASGLFMALRRKRSA